MKETKPTKKESARWIESALLQPNFSGHKKAATLLGVAAGGIEEKRGV